MEGVWGNRLRRCPQLSGERLRREPEPRRARAQRGRMNAPSNSGCEAKSDQFDAGHGGVVTLAGAELEDAGVPTRALGVARADVVHELGRDLLIPDVGEDLAVVVEAALLGLGDHPL